MARRRGGDNRKWLVVVVILVCVGTGYWWMTSSSRQAARPIEIAPGGQAQTEQDDSSTTGTPVQDPGSAAPLEPVPLPADQTLQADRSSDQASDQPQAASKALARAEQALAAGDLLAARALYRAAFNPAAPQQVIEPIAKKLHRLADDTLFSLKVLPKDPLTGFHVVEKGETLGKIAKNYKVTATLLAKINELRNPNLIRYKQRLKIIHGPFHAVVYKKRYKMFVYCQDTLVRIFPVGLGAEGTTPEGLWRIKDRLINPTYYPPRGGKIIQADDPNNPLGEHWLSLEGLEGEAKGQERYGIHGTIEPESVGKDVSLGCIRMYNEDVSFLFDLMTVGSSLVTVKK